MKYPLSASAIVKSKQIPPGAGIIVFDSFCIICSSTVNLLSNIDKAGLLYYTSFETKTGKEIKDLLPVETDSIIFVRDGIIHLRSDAVIKIIDTLGYPWKMLGFIRFIPKVIRESLYNFIARNRYKIFKHKKECSLPSPIIRKRFLK